MSIERVKALKLIESISEKKLNVIIDFIQYLLEKEEWEATNELIDSKIILEIKEGQKQIGEGEFVRFNDVQRNV